MASRALLSGTVEAVVAMFVMTPGRLGARSRAVRGALARGPGMVRAASSVSVAQVSLMWNLKPFQWVSRLTLQRASVS
jgi:hypothetical protein